MFQQVMDMGAFTAVVLCPSVSLSQAGIASKLKNSGLRK